MVIKLEEIKKEYEKILKQLTKTELISNWEKFEELSKKKGYFEKIITKNEELEKIQNKIEENKAILAAQEDPELISLAEEDLRSLKEKENKLKKELENLLRQKGEPDQIVDSLIVEIRAGAGGDEAALFAANLFRMYSKYARHQGWKQKILDSRPTELGGFKEIIFELKNSDVFSKMRYEAGVHRVQRIPITEKSGRIHTSTASVAVLPKPKEAKIRIKPDDLKIDFYRASGPGGQYVNRRETAVRITHLPSGIVVTSQTERNQLQNRENAMKILQARLFERNRIEREQKISGERKIQIGRMMRAEKIRTYNFPQDRITDHRIKKSFHNIEEILDGKLDSIFKALQKKKFKIE